MKPEFPGYCVMACGNQEVENLVYMYTQNFFTSASGHQPAFFPPITRQHVASFTILKERLIEKPHLVPIAIFVPHRTEPDFIDELKSVKEIVPNTGIILLPPRRTDQIIDHVTLWLENWDRGRFKLVLEALLYRHAYGLDSALLNDYYCSVITTPHPEMSPVAGDPDGEYSPLTMLAEMMRGTKDGKRYLKHLREVYAIEV